MDADDSLVKSLLEIIPPVMHQIRVEIRAGAQGELTIPQFRILANINRGLQHVGQIAEHHGVTQPAMSKMVDVLVKRGLIRRTPGKVDRRQILLDLTPKGRELLTRARTAAQVRLAERIKDVSPADRESLFEALNKLKTIFSIQGRS